MFYIFRKSDGVILYTPATQRQFDNEWAACLRNEGGVAADYVVKEANRPAIVPGDIPLVATLVQDQVVFVPNPIGTARAAVRQSARDKLRALGLTEEEVRLIA